MAINLSTGIRGFICSAIKRAGQYVSSFESGRTGWIVYNNGKAEFKEIYVRDKLVTNEYVYNRIRVTEDEEVITSNGKILAAVPNADSTYTVTLDLREGDINPFTDGDLLQGYYHNPANSGVIFALQRMTVMVGPTKNSQSMTVMCEGSDKPYPNMIVVRVGNTGNEDRQAFIKISSRTNSMHFYDGIASWEDMDNPDRLKCILGKVDTNTLPEWMRKAIGSVKKWFGLIADGVILKGTFILSSNKRIEDELDDRETELRGDFEIREDGITGKWQEAITAANSAADSLDSVRELSSEFIITAGRLEANFKETVENSMTDAVDTITTVKDNATSSLQQTARELTINFSNTVTESTTTATDEINSTKETATSSLNMTADELKTSFEKSFTDADGKISQQIKSEVTQSADGWKVEIMGSDENGNPNTILAAINADESGIKIKGKQISLTGTFSANDNVVIHEDGTIEAKNARIHGYIASPFTYIAISDAIEVEPGKYKLNNNLNLITEGEDIILPTDKKYNGSHVMICNIVYPPYSRLSLTMSSIISVEDNTPLRGINRQDNITEDTEDPIQLKIIGATIELLGIPKMDPGSLEVLKTEWMVLNYR